MKKITLALLALLLAAVLPLAAMAEATLESSFPVERSVSLSSATNCYYTRTSEGYQVFDAAGNPLSAAYGSLYARQYGLYYEVANENGLNNLGLLDAAGKELLPLAYGDFEFINDDWVLAYVLEATDADTGEYKDSDGNKYNVARTDVLYQGQLIGSLTREDYIKSYSVGARGAWLYVRTSTTNCYWLDSSFNRTNVMVDGYVSTSEYQNLYKKGVLHNPTQQYAFTSACTLTADQVEQSVWYDDNTDSLLDLQGNVIASNLFYDYTYSYGDHLSVKRNGLYGIITRTGEEIVAPTYKELAYYNDELFSSGYNAMLDEKGRLSYIDTNGQVTASVDYELSSSDYKGFTFNAPMVAVNNMGKYLIITATHGELAEKYNDVATGRAGQRILSVQKGESWGCIDMAGNVVVPFEHRYSLDISADGTLVTGRTDNGDYMIYRISYADHAAEEDSVPGSWTETKQSGTEMDTTPVLNEGAWECSCGTITNGKFCPECGAAKPEAAPAPAEDDGSWDCACGSHNTGKFCPECGAAKPADKVVCSGCGYEPAEGETPKFCPECGTKF